MTREEETGQGAPTQSGTGEMTAPSIGPNTVIEKEDPGVRLARHEQSDTDAMGLDKRREVVGGRYSPSIAKQATLYGIFLAVVAALVIGALIAVNELDKAPAQSSNEAPWAGNDREPVPLQ